MEKPEFVVAAEEMKTVEVWENKLAEQFLLYGETYPGHSHPQIQNKNIRFLHEAQIQRLDGQRFEES